MKAQTSHSRVSEHGAGLGTVTPEMVEERAKEIAITNGRPPERFNEADMAQAREELLNIKDEMPTTDETGESVGGWDEIPGEGARQRTTKSAVDPQIEAEQIVEEGVDEAAHEQMVEGNKLSRESDRL